MEEKKEYLKSYILQEAKLRRYNEALNNSPDKKEILKKIAECKEKRIQIENKIKSIKDETLAEVLYEKYVLGKTLEQIANNLNYSVRQIQRLHIKGLEKIIL